MAQMESLSCVGTSPGVGERLVPMPLWGHALSSNKVQTYHRPSFKRERRAEMDLVVELIAASLFVAVSALCVAKGQHLFATTSTELDAAFRDFSSTSRFSALDGLRACSVLAVIWCHVAGPQSLNLLNQGNKGVDLFFAISGFLVTNLLVRERRREGRISLRNFFIRRTLRIFPLYYAVLSMYCVLVFFTFHGTPKATEFWQNFPAFVTYTSNWFVSLENGADHGVTFYFAWSLATEEQFYLFWPPLLALVVWKTGRYWAAAVVAGVLLLVQGVASASSGGLVFTMLGSLAPAILLGVIFALLLNSRRFFHLLYPSLGHPYAPAVSLALLLVCLQADAPRLLTAFLIAIFVVSLCVRESTALHKALTLKPLAFLGSISYGVYLMHMLAANAARKAIGHQQGLDVFLATVVVVTVMAYLSFRFFEAPLLRLKNRFRGDSSESEVPLGTSAGTL